MHSLPLSLLYQTEFFIAAFNADVREDPDAWVVTTPTNPTYHWGNYLLFKQAGAGVAGQINLKSLTERFQAAFAHAPKVGHVAIAWDEPLSGLNLKALLGACVSLGFEVLQSQVMALNRAAVTLSNMNHATLVRPLCGDAEWDQATRLQIASRPEHFSRDEYETYMRSRMAHLKAMANAGLGFWMGAFTPEGLLVGDLGVFGQKGGVARFQCVETAAGFRNQGVCTTLVATACLAAFEYIGARTVAIIADPGSQAEKIYRSVGFEAVEHRVRVCKRNVPNLEVPFQVQFEG